MHCPEPVQIKVNELLTNMKENDLDGDGFIQLDEILVMLHKKKEVEESMLGKGRKKYQLQGASKQEQNLATPKIPSRSLCCDPKIALEKPVKGTTCFFMTPKHPLRGLVLGMYYSPLRQGLTAGVIAVSGTLAGLRFAQVRPDGFRSDVEAMVGTATFNSLVYLIDGLFVFFLLTEILLRIGAYGLYAQDENLSYFRNKNGMTWRIIDILIVVTSAQYKP